MGNLKGKKCLITAAAHGIGLASVKALAAAGVEVIASDIDEKGLDEISGISGVKTRLLDVLKPEEIEKAHEEIGEIDILFNCAGIVHAGTILESSEAELDFALDLNIKAMVRMIKTFLPGMLARGDGTIINMASVVSSITGAPNRFIYGATKAGVIGLTKAVAADYVAKGIRCNAICPGTVDSPSLHERLRAQGDYEKARAAFVARQPIGRIGEPEEIADLVVYLASASYTTGQAYVIDGGWTI